MSKRVLSIVQVTDEAKKSFKFYPRLIYTTLLRCKGRQSTVSKLHRYLSLSRATIAKAREVLITLGLATKHKGRITASRPDAETMTWFYHLKNPLWWKSFQYFRFHAPSVASPLDHRGLAVLGYLAFRAGKTKTANSITYCYVAVKTGLDYRSVAKYMVALDGAKFIDHKRQGDREFFSVPIVNLNAKPEWFQDKEKVEKVKVACKIRPQKSLENKHSGLCTKSKSDIIETVNERHIEGSEDANSDTGRKPNRHQPPGHEDHLPGPETRRILQNFTGYELEPRWVEQFIRTVGKDCMPSVGEFDRMIYRARDQDHLISLVRDHVEREREELGKP